MFQGTRREELLESPTHYDLISESCFKCVKKGDTEGLRELLENNQSTDFFTAIEDLEQAKNNYAFLVARCAYYSGSAGVSAVTIGALFRKYMLVHKQAASIADLRPAAIAALKEFTTAIAAQKKSPRSPFVLAVEQIIAMHVFDEINVSAIAAQSNMSLSSLEHRFKKETGHTLTHAIRQAKITKACRMLAEGSLSCAEIATKLNFCSQSYFSKCFKDTIGMTPLEYRDKFSSRFPQST